VGINLNRLKAMIGSDLLSNVFGKDTAFVSTMDAKDNVFNAPL
jgi:hypothetical protein